MKAKTAIDERSRYHPLHNHPLNV